MRTLIPPAKSTLRPNYLSQLERGAKRPRGATLKLLSLIKCKGLEAVP
jgi:DNA-binding transcriptional regulator YiaG